MQNQVGCYRNSLASEAAFAHANGDVETGLRGMLTVSSVRESGDGRVRFARHFSRSSDEAILRSGRCQCDRGGGLMTQISRRRVMQQGALAMLGGSALLRSAYAVDGSVTANTQFGKGGIFVTNPSAIPATSINSSVRTYPLRRRKRSG